MITMSVFVMAKLYRTAGKTETANVTHVVAAERLSPLSPSKDSTFSVAVRV